MGETVIEVEGVSKRYQLGEHHTSLRDLITATAQRVRSREGRSGRDELWALRDLSFEVREGEAVGIVGRNGAGKSTLLKVLTRITEPTTGVARSRGRVGALLEVGTGFHQELTGRENVYLNGAILGMGRKGVARRFDEIVEFAGVERFIDTPVKRYSSGMYLRLAFAVAAHLDAEIMVVDEVLAVGDAEFQRKCLGKMAEVERSGRTVLFVSHNLDAVMRLCSRTLWLERGQLVAEGPTGEVVDRYLAAGVSHAAVTAIEAEPGAPVVVERLGVRGPGGGAAGAVLRREEPLTIEVDLHLEREVEHLDLAVSVQNLRGVRLLDEAWSDTAPASRGAAGRYRCRLEVPPVLNAGDYALSLWVGSPYETFVWADSILTFRLEGSTQARSERALQLGLAWDVEVTAEAGVTG